MKYTKPIIVSSVDMAEGIYADSGSTCYTTTAKIHQVPEIGRGDYRIQVDARHHGDHTKEKQRLIITFNQAVIYKWGGSCLISGDNTPTLEIQLQYHQNPNDNIGFGDLIVESDPGLSIFSADVYDD